MQVSVETITPQRAEEFLASNTRNRPIRARIVRGIVKQMVEGQWKQGGDPIRFSKSGVLLDGQHRLTGLVQSGQTYDMVIIRGLEDEVFDVLDTGIKRSAGDVMGMAGHPDANNMAALIRKIINWEAGRNSILSSGSTQSGAGHGNSVTNQEIRDFAAKNDVTAYMVFGHRCRKENPSMMATEWAFLYWLFNKQHTDAAWDFMQKLALGVGLDPRHQILLLRNRLMGNAIRGGQGGMNLTGRAKFILIVKSWNWYRQGKLTGQVSYSPNDDFPKIL